MKAIFRRGVLALLAMVLLGQGLPAALAASDGRGVSRAQLTQILYNMEGRPQAEKPNYVDVDATAWYADLRMPPESATMHVFPCHGRMRGGSLMEPVNKP